MESRSTMAAAPSSAVVTRESASTIVARTVAIAELPAWVRADEGLRAAGIGDAVDLQATEAALRAEGWEILAVGEPEPIDAAELVAPIAAVCFAGGVSLGCCGALANDLVLRRAATDLGAALRRVRFTVRRR